jgi:hypothetical protein
MLADRLMTKSDFDCSKEVATLELLKLRFGESNLNEIEVMLAVSDSQPVRMTKQYRTCSIMTKDDCL